MRPALAADALQIGSKRFTESYVLGELLKRQAESGGGPAEHKSGLGNTAIVYQALRAGSIDVYPEYTGTIAKEILKLEGNPGMVELNAALAPLGLAVAVPLGFNDSYAIGVREEQATQLGLKSIADLAAHKDLHFGLSQEFLARQDGWPGLAKAYKLESFSPTGLDHGIAYEALAGKRIDVMDIYSTDAKIQRYHIKLLADDRGYFPHYDAVLLYRKDVPQRVPKQWAALAKLEKTIDEARMQRMNAAVELEGKSFTEAAGLYFSEPPSGKSVAQTSTPVPAERKGFWDVLFAPDLGKLTLQHLLLVFVSLVASIVIGIPLAVLAFRKPWLEQPVFAIVGVIQTIPSLALLAFLIVLTGSIGTAPALIALFLYGLLPIVRSTHAGLRGVGEGLRQAATALSLTKGQQLRLVELPLAMPSIFAGIKTSAVISVGTATIAAFIGAGGYGERIASGLAVNDTTMLLAGAVPAAILALIVQGAFELIERHTDPLKKY
ncbi:MAG TPA: glycine betaine ABC transporter substrate-binding protein [Burkholderiales bacterium]|nr:glycine betaine ABC transporter substrate-binding protein [Burkholderiales bacterium]